MTLVKQGAIAAVVKWTTILIPLAILVVDTLRAPVLFYTWRSRDAVRSTELLANLTVRLGTIKGQPLYVVLDDVGRQDSLAYVKSAPTGIVVAMFPRRGLSAFGNAIVASIARVDPIAAQDVRDKLDLVAKSSQLDVTPVAVQSQARTTPISALFLVALDEHSSELPTVGPSLWNAISKTNARNIVLPCLGYNWQDKNTPSFDDCYGGLLTKLIPDKGLPHSIYLMLYSAWPTFVLEQSLGSINTWWSGIAPAADIEFYNADQRLLLLCLALCMYVCSRSMVITVKAGLLIGGAFIAASAGIIKVIDSLVGGQVPWRVQCLKALCLLVLAAGFPRYAQWSVKDIFPTERTDHA